MPPKYIPLYSAQKNWRVDGAGPFSPLDDTGEICLDWSTGPTFQESRLFFLGGDGKGVGGRADFCFEVGIPAEFEQPEPLVSVRYELGWPWEEIDLDQMIVSASITIPVDEFLEDSDFKPDWSPDALWLQQKSTATPLPWLGILPSTSCGSTRTGFINWTATSALRWTPSGETPLRWSCGPGAGPGIHLPGRSRRPGGQQGRWSAADHHPG